MPSKESFPPEPNYAVFASYSHEDNEIVSSLVQLLRAAGPGVFRDIDSIPPGSRWRAVTAEAITHCQMFLLFWCRHAAMSRSVMSEYEQAVTLQKRIIPIILDSTTMPSHLSEYQVIDIRAALGKHQEKYVEEEGSAPKALPDSSIRFKRLVVLQPEHAKLVQGALQVWTDIGGLLSRERE